MTRVEWFVSSEAETQAVARRLANFLRPGDVLWLIGEMGVGKTTFTRYLVSALESPASVSSPTFTLIHEYPGGRLPIFHADAYRLQSAEDAAGTGLEEYLARADAVLLIEWPERIAALLPPERLEITITDTGEPGEGRHFTLTPCGTRWSDFAERWKEVTHADSVA